MVDDANVEAPVHADVPVAANKLTLTGQLRVHRVAECRDQVIQAMQEAAASPEGPRVIELNVEQVDGCDTAGLQFLLMCLKPAPDAVVAVRVSAVSPAIADAATRAAVPLNLLSVATKLIG